MGYLKTALLLPFKIMLAVLLFLLKALWLISRKVLSVVFAYGTTAIILKTEKEFGLTELKRRHRQRERDKLRRDALKRSRERQSVSYDE